MEKEPITSEGLKKIKKELEELKNIKRPKVIEAIAEARAHGDLKENAEYHAAKEEQAKIESRVIEINDLIARANVIDVTKIEKKDKTTSKYASTELSDKTVNFTKDLVKNKKKLKFKEYGPFYGIKENGMMIKGILKGPKGENAQTDYYGLFAKNDMFWKGYSKHTYNDGRILFQYNEYKLDENGKVIIDKDGIYQLVDTYLISEDDFAKVKKYIAYDIPIPFSFYDFDTGETTQTTEVNETETSQTVEKTQSMVTLTEGETSP